MKNMKHDDIIKETLSAMSIVTFSYNQLSKFLDWLEFLCYQKTPEISNEQYWLENTCYIPMYLINILVALVPAEQTQKCVGFQDDT